VAAASNRLPTNRAHVVPPASLTRSNNAPTNLAFQDEVLRNTGCRRGEETFRARRVPVDIRIEQLIIQKIVLEITPKNRGL
jgi:hypothetical protein